MSFSCIISSITSWIPVPGSVLPSLERSTDSEPLLSSAEDPLQTLAFKISDTFATRQERRVEAANRIRRAAKRRLKRKVFLLLSANPEWVDDFQNMNASRINLA